MSATPAVKATLFHNPRCSKSRGALALLQERGVDVQIRDYLGQPPSPQELLALLGALNLPAQAIVRFGEDTAKQLGLAKDDLRSQQEWLALLSSHPILIERPIAQVGERAVVGRPPENVLGLLG
ncbi:MAG: arsenate reductase (glutaredoxin) [Burkholderiaceae bacterium]|nr:MAG: arsenate reductase (glutaredoxin) [Burkholderiaceae bacterium]